MRHIVFRGLRPKFYTDHSENYAQVAENVLIYGNQLQPLPGPRLEPVALTTVDGAVIAPKDCVTLHRSDGVLIGWPKHVTITRDPQQRFGPGTFLYADNGMLWRTSGARILCDDPPVPVGICAPGVAPQTTVLPGQGCTAGEPTLLCVPQADADTCPTRDGSGWEDADVPEQRVYVYTYMTADRQESAPSPISAPVDVLFGDGVVVASSDTPPAHAVSRLWYRAAANSAGEADFFFIGETPIGTPMLLDALCPLDLGPILTTWSHFPPPCVDGVTSFGDATTLVWSGRDFWLSEPRLPHAYKPKNRKTVDYLIVRAVESQNASIEGSAHFNVAVLTNGLHYLVTGRFAAEAQIQQLAYEHPLENPRAVCQAEGGIVFSSKTGLAILRGNSLDLLAEELTTRDEWPEFAPDDLQLVFRGGDIIGLSRGGGFVFHLQPYAQEKPLSLTTHTVTSSAAFTAPDTELFICTNNSVATWGKGAPLTLRWRSANIVQRGLWHPSAFKAVFTAPRRPTKWQPVERLFHEWKAANCATPPVVFFQQKPEYAPHQGWLLDAPAVQLTWFRDDSAWFARPVRDVMPHRMPRHNNALRWAVEVSASFPIYELHYQTSGEDLVSEGGHA